MLRVWLQCGIYLGGILSKCKSAFMIKPSSFVTETNMITVKRPQPNKVKY